MISVVSPQLAFFLHLYQGQLIARSRRIRSTDVGRDIALDRERYGCLAVDSIYNIYYETDPVAFTLNSAVRWPSLHCAGSTLAETPIFVYLGRCPLRQIDQTDCDPVNQCRLTQEPAIDVRASDVAVRRLFPLCESSIDPIDALWKGIALNQDSH